MNPPLKLKTFQRQDLARGAMHDGFIAGLDTGLGKSIFAYAWALLKTGWSIVPRLPDAVPVAHRADRPRCLRPNAPVLLVVPGDLHAQMAREGWEKLRVETRPLDSQATFLRLCQSPDSAQPQLDATGRPIIPPGFYITSYTQLCTNGVTRLPDPLDWDKPRELLQWASLPERSPADDRQEAAARKLLDGDLPFASVNHVFLWRDRVWREEFDLLQVHREDTRVDLDAAYEREVAALERLEADEAANRARKLEAAYVRLQNLFTYRACPQYAELTLAQQDFVIREFLRRRFLEYAEGIGTHRDYPQGPIPAGYDPAKPETDTRPQWRIKCIYTPALYDLAYNAFDVVGVDEGVKMKGEDTFTGIGVRSMLARARLVLSATPVKNRLPDIFRLAWWACGGHTEATPRFPFRDEASDREQFAKMFMVTECNLTKQKQAEKKRQADRTARQMARAMGQDVPPSKEKASRYIKVTAEICNVHRLWKLLAPIVLRRRKEECGEDIVPRVRKVVRVALGTQQRRVVRYHLEAPYLDCNGAKAHGPQLTSLRIAACDPTATCLPYKGDLHVNCPCRDAKDLRPADARRVKMGQGRADCPHCHGSGKEKLVHVSGNPYTPKFAAVLTIVREILDRGESVLVGTTFNEAHDHLAGLLREAGVPHVVADGRLSPARRGPLLQRFRAGEWPVCLAGVESVANGHNLDTVNNVVIYAYAWAYDLVKQFLDRVHRLTSRRPVNVYVVFTTGTMDQKLEALNAEKTSSVELALDGRLIGERSEEVNLAELLDSAREEFAASGNETVDEAAIQREWPLLRAQLSTAYTVWQRAHPTPTLTLEAPARSATHPVRVAIAPPASPVTPPDWRTQMRSLAERLRTTDLWDML